jgi:WD40 repeat protein
MAFDYADAFLLFACKKSLGVIALRQESAGLTELTNWAGNNHSLLCISAQPQAVIAGLQNGQVISFKAGSEMASSPGTSADSQDLGFAFNTILMDQHRGPCSCIWPIKQTKGFMTGGFDGTIIIWDSQLNRVQKIDLQSEFTFKLSSTKIKSLCEDAISGEIIVSTRAGDIFELNIKEKVHQNRVLMKGHLGNIKGIDILPGRSEIVTLGQEGTLVVRDFEKFKHKLVIKLEFEGSQIASNLDGNHVAVGFTNGILQIVDINNTAILLRIEDQKSPIVVLKYSGTSNNYLLASAAQDGQIIFYRVDCKYQRVATIDNVQAIPLALDFSEDARSIQVVTINFTVRYYTTEEDSRNLTRIKESKKKNTGFEVDDFKNETWQTWTLPFGWHVQGLLKDKEIISLISCLKRSPDKRFMAIGLLNGSVRLYRFPCVGDEPSFVEFKVHSGPVGDVVFDNNSHYFFTIGRNEKNVIQWSYNIFEDSYLPRAAATEAKILRKETLAERSLIPLTQRERIRTRNESYDNLNKRLAEAPDQHLELKQVLGYNANCKCNVALFTATNSVVFMSGNKVVVEEFTKDAKVQTFFTHHYHEVTALDMTKNKETVATGDQGGFIFVWHYDSKDVSSHLRASKTEGIIKLRFSAEGSKLVAVSQDRFYTLDVFDHPNQQLLQSVRTHEGPVLSLNFGSDEDFVTVAADRIRFWEFRGANLVSTLGDWRTLEAEDIDSNDTKQKVEEVLTTGTYAFSSKLCLTGTSKGRIYRWEKKAFKSSFKSPLSKAISRMVSYKNILYVGSDDGSIVTWVEGEGKLILDRTFTMEALQRIAKFGIRSLDVASTGASLFMLIGTDTGKLFISDQMEEARSPSKDQSLGSKIEKSHPASSPPGVRYVTQSHSGSRITALATNELLPLIVTGGDDNRLILWNAAKQKVENIAESNPQDHFFTAVDWSPDGEYIAAAASSRTIYMFDKALNFICKDQELFKELKDEHIPVLRISKAPYFVAVSSEGSSVIHIFTFLAKNKQLQYKQAISAELSAPCRFIDWTYDSEFLSCTMDNFEQRYLDLKINTITTYPTVADKHWVSWTQPLGPMVTGIHTDERELRYNPVHRSHTYVLKALDYDLEVDGKPVRRLVVSGDRDGNIYLYRYPCVHPNSSAKIYQALPGFLTHLKMFGNDEYVVAVGEKTNTITIYQTDFKNDNKISDNVEALMKYKDSPKAADVYQIEILPSPSRLPVKEEKNSQVAQKNSLWMENMHYPTNYIKPAINSHLAPKIKLRPAYAFGFRSKDMRDNLKYLSREEVLYATGCLLVIHHSVSNRQRFFMGHDADVSCFSIRNYPKLVASGDLSTPPNICIWSPDSLSTIRKIQVPKHNLQGLLKVQFATDGPYLAAIGVDEHSTVFVFDFQKGFLLHSMPGDGIGERIFDLKWVSAKEFITVGVNHFKYWTVDNSQLQDVRGRFDPKNGQQRMLCCATNRKDVLAGTLKGELLVWRRSQNYTDFPQLFSLFSDTQVSSNAVEMICVSEQK